MDKVETVKDIIRLISEDCTEIIIFTEAESDDIFTVCIGIFHAFHRIFIIAVDDDKRRSL